MSRSNLPTVAYLRTSALDLCYSDYQLQALCDRAALEGPLAVLLSIPAGDAIRVLAGLLPASASVAWAQASARRAKEYAARCAARCAARSADVAAAHYAYAAAAAHYAYAAADAAANAEQQIAIRHGAMLLGWGPE